MSWLPSAARPAEEAFRRSVRDRAVLTGRERTFGADEVIVSKTDPKGVITYANEVFLRVSGYREEELIGAPHSILRHPDMPRCVFQFLWDVIGGGRECFAYVVNRARGGDHYWVFAHVTPTFGPDGRIVAYHSNRRCPRREAVERIKPIYAALAAEEARHADRRTAVAAGLKLLTVTVQSSGMSYDELVFAI